MGREYIVTGNEKGNILGGTPMKRRTSPMGGGTTLKGGDPSPT